MGGGAGFSALGAAPHPVIRTTFPRERREGKACAYFLFFASQSCCSLVRNAAHWSATSLAVFWPRSTSWKFLIATWSTKQQSDASYKAVLEYALDPDATDEVLLVNLTSDGDVQSVTSAD